jgi:hypothetical protein
MSRNIGAIVLISLISLLAFAGFAIIFLIYYGMFPDPREVLLFYGLILFWLLRRTISLIFGVKK